MRKPKDFYAWIGLSKSTDYGAAPWLGPIVGMLIILLVLLAVLITIATIFHFVAALFGFGIQEGQSPSESIRNYGLVLAAVLSAPFIVWRSIVAAEQAKTAAEALFNDKVSAAAEGLSARRQVNLLNADTEEHYFEWQDDLVARAVAIDRLEGLAFERSDVSPRIVRMLATYVRGNFPCFNTDPTDELKRPKTPRMDLQRAVDAIGRILPMAAKADETEWRLDLQACDFDGVRFSSGYFRAVNASGSRFEAATFFKGNFEGCLMIGCLLNYGNFHHANFRGAKLNRAIVTKPEPVPGGMVQSINFAEIIGVSLAAADISAIDYLGEASDIAKTFGTLDTKIYRDVEERRPTKSEWERGFNFRRYSGKKELTAEQIDLVKKLEASGFQNWSPYSSSDGMTDYHTKKFYEELEMAHWPFW